MLRVTPISYIHWLSQQAWLEFESAYRAWLEKRREYLSTRLGVELEGVEA